MVSSVIENAIFLALKRDGLFVCVCIYEWMHECVAACKYSLYR